MSSKLQQTHEPNRVHQGFFGYLRDLSFQQLCFIEIDCLEYLVIIMTPENIPALK